jgi:hypothetical protein
MSTTRWERLRALSDRLRSVWDAHRDGRDWADVYTEARERTAARMEADAQLIRAMSWDEFKRLQQIGPVSAEGVSS